MDKFKQFLFSDTISHPKLEGKTFDLLRRSRSEKDGKKSNSIKRQLEARLSYLTAGTGWRGDQETSNHHASLREKGHTLLGGVIPERHPPAKSVQATALFCSETLVLGPQSPSGEDCFKNKMSDLMNSTWSGTSLVQGPTYCCSCFFRTFLICCSFERLNNP